jgi:small-conductance mechanosensitive channel
MSILQLSYLFTFVTMDCLRRLCSVTNNMTVDVDEDKRIYYNVHNKNKKYLVQRKTQLIFMIIIYTISLSYTLYTVITEMQITYDDNTIQQISYYSWRIILVFFCSINEISLILLICARYFWNEYKISNRLVLLSYFIRLILHMMIIQYNKYHIISGVLYYIGFFLFN